MRDSKLIERALRAFAEWASMGWFEHLRHRSMPPPPFFETKHPREENPHHEYWLRIRSNPFRSNYH